MTETAQLKAMKGRLIAEIINDNESVRESGIIIIDRKDVPVRAKVLSVGKDSYDKHLKKPLESPAKVGDIIHFKKYKPHFHQMDAHGTKEGIVTVWWSDIVAVESIKTTDKANVMQLKAPWDMVIVTLILKEVSSYIIIPQDAAKREKGFHGRVEAIGPLYPNKELKVGDNIIFPRHEGIPVLFNEHEYLSLRERWVHAVTEEQGV